MEGQKYLPRIGINNFTYRRYNMDYFLDSAERLGVKNIELCGCHPHFTVYESEEFPAQGLAEKIKSRGLKVSAILPEQNFLPVNIASTNEYLRQQSVEQMKFYVRNAKLFDCDKVILYPGKALMDKPVSVAWAQAKKSLKEICSTAEEFGVDILLESVSNFVSSLMMDIDSVKQMLDEVESERMCVCVNSCAAYFANETLEDYFEKFGDKIKLVQLSDSVSDNDQLIWGEGEQDFKKHFATLDKYGYSGDIIMELMMEEYAYEAEENYKACIDYLMNM